MSRIQRIIVSVNPVAWFILAFALMCCAYEVGRVLHLRPQPIHLWRQCDCLSLTRNYYDGGCGFLFPEMHARIADNYTSGRTAGEFPLLYYAVAMIWRVTGPSEFVYRLFELLLHFAGSFALFASIKRILGSVFWAGAVTLLFFTSPILVYYSISFLTDVPALDLALIGWWCIVRYATEHGRRHYLLAICCFTLAMLLKITAGMSLLALLGVLAVQSIRRKKGLSKSPPFRHPVINWVLPLAGLALVGAWYVYAEYYNHQHGAKYTFNGLWPLWQMNAAEVDEAWRTGKEFIVFEIFDTSIWILMGAALGMICWHIRRVPWQMMVLNITLILGTLVYVLCWFQALDNHDYYFINPMIMLVVLLVSALHLLKGTRPAALKNRWGRVGIVALLLFNTAYAAQNAQMRYHGSSELTSAALLPIYHKGEMERWKYLWGRGMDGLLTIEPYLHVIGVKKDDLVIYPDDDSINGALVLMGRHGWTSFGVPSLEAAATYDLLIERGAAYVMLWDRAWEKKAELRPYFTHPVGEYRGIRIYDLRTALIRNACQSSRSSFPPTTRSVPSRTSSSALSPRRCPMVGVARSSW